MLIAKDIYSNTDRFIVGNETRFFYFGNLYDKESLENETIYLCYSESKPRKNQYENITKVKMNCTVKGAQVSILLKKLGNSYLYFEKNQKKDNNRGHYYKIVIEEMPLALLVLKQSALPQTVSKFDYFKDQVKERLQRAIEAFGKLKSLSNYSKERNFYNS